MAIMQLKLCALRNETGTKQFQNCFETVLFQFHFLVPTVLCATTVCCVALKTVILAAKTLSGSNAKHAANSRHQSCQQSYESARYNM